MICDVVMNAQYGKNISQKSHGFLVQGAKSFLRRTRHSYTRDKSHTRPSILHTLI